VKAKSTVNSAGNYTKPEMRKRLFESIKAKDTHGTKAGEWSARKAQLLAKLYKEKGGGYK
jgi:UTP:GlnB (protein PII) uridylyltransferase